MTDFKRQTHDIAKRDLVESLIKGVEVIQAFNETLPRMSISEVAERVGLSRAAARRYLLTLVHIGLATTDGRCFSLTHKVANLGLYLNAPRTLSSIELLSHRLLEAAQIGESRNANAVAG
jgi:IclR family transcriptional regulator, pca regulon regulatory protein